MKNIDVRQHIADCHKANTIPVDFYLMYRGERGHDKIQFNVYIGVPGQKGVDVGVTENIHIREILNELDVDFVETKRGFYVNIGNNLLEYAPFYLYNLDWDIEKNQKSIIKLILDSYESK